ncbi:hypothetical protein T439DRAFT_357964 [Meredithblackwellia eburnea MCA 4105]
MAQEGKGERAIGGEVFDFKDREEYTSRNILQDSSPYRAIMMIPVSVLEWVHRAFENLQAEEAAQMNVSKTCSGVIVDQIKLKFVGTNQLDSESGVDTVRYEVQGVSPEALEKMGDLMKGKISLSSSGVPRRVVEGAAREIARSRQSAPSSVVDHSSAGATVRSRHIRSVHAKDPDLAHLQELVAWRSRFTDRGRAGGEQSLRNKDVRFEEPAALYMEHLARLSRHHDLAISFAAKEDWKEIPKEVQETALYPPPSPPVSPTHALERLYTYPSVLLPPTESALGEEDPHKGQGQGKGLNESHHMELIWTHRPDSGINPSQVQHDPRLDSRYAFTGFKPAFPSLGLGLGRRFARHLRYHVLRRRKQCEADEFLRASSGRGESNLVPLSDNKVSAMRKTHAVRQVQAELDEGEELRLTTYRMVTAPRLVPDRSDCDG